MKKQAVNLLGVFLLGIFLSSFFAAAQTSEEVRQEKLEYQNTRAPLETFLQTVPTTSFEEEMRQTKLEVHAFWVAQRRARPTGSETGAQAPTVSRTGLNQVERNPHTFPNPCQQHILP